MTLVTGRKFVSAVVVAAFAFSWLSLALPVAASPLGVSGQIGDGTQVCVSGSTIPEVNGTYTWASGAFRNGAAWMAFDPPSGPGYYYPQWALLYPPLSTGYESTGTNTGVISDPALNGGSWVTLFANTPTSLSVTPCTNAVAAIELNIPNAPSGLWVGVQWKDGLGNWHDVETWFGTYNAEGYGWTRRWVLPEHFGTGPYRWVVYTQAGGSLWGTSADFKFPTTVGQVTWSTVVKAK